MTQPAAILSVTPSTPLLRRVGPTLAGLFAIIVVTTVTDAVLHAAGVFPPLGQRASDGAFVVALAYRILYGIGGGYLTARLARDRPMRHALALGVVGLIISTVGAIVAATHEPALGPLWYPLALVVVAVPCAWAGGRLRARR